MPSISVVTIRDKNTLNTKPRTRVITENMVNKATALNNLIISPPKNIFYKIKY